MSQVSDKVIFEEKTIEVAISATEVAKKRGYTIHEAAALFEMQDKDQLVALANDIKRNGQKFPILHQGKVIIDGRNRLVACEHAGVEPAFEEVKAGADAVEQIVSLNLLRRNLDEGKRAMMALQLIPKLKATDAQDKKSGKANDLGRSGKVSERVAAMCGVSSRIIERIQRIVRLAPHRLQEIETGEKTIGEIDKDIINRKQKISKYLPNEFKAFEDKCKDKEAQVADEFAKLYAKAEEKADSNPSPKVFRKSVLIVLSENPDEIAEMLTLASEGGKEAIGLFPEHMTDATELAPFLGSVNAYVSKPKNA